MLKYIQFSEENKEQIFQYAKNLDTIYSYKENDCERQYVKPVVMMIIKKRKKIKKMAK